MRLLWLYLIFSCYFSKNISYPVSQKAPENVWKQSRYIIDNRRNLLFNRPFVTLYTNANPITPLYSESINATARKNNKPFIELQKDLSVEASVKNDYFQDYSSKNFLKASNDNYLYKITNAKGEKNYTETDYSTQNVIQNYNIGDISGSLDKSVVKVAHNQFVDEQMLKWVPNSNSNLYVVNAPEKTGSSIIHSSLESQQKINNDIQDLNFRNGGFDYSESRNDFKLAPVATFTTTPSNIWDNSNYHPELTRIQNDKNVEPKEKHVYETRIETVSYHREVILNSAKEKDELSNARDGNDKEKQPEDMPETNYEEKEINYEEEEKNYEEPEKNYEVDESIHVMTNGRFHGPSKTEVEDNNNKFGFVVEGKNYRRYRVEERTPDGFIVGEYGVVSHDDGSLRGVRYTADSTANPQLIYQALINFLSL